MRLLRAMPNKRPRVPNPIRMECLEYFRKGFGYKKTASLLNLNPYTVREYLRRYKDGDISWVDRGPRREVGNEE